MNKKTLTAVCTAASCPFPPHTHTGGLKVYSSFTATNPLAPPPLLFFLPPSHPPSCLAITLHTAAEPPRRGPPSAGPSIRPTVTPHPLRLADGASQSLLDLRLAPRRVSLLPLQLVPVPLQSTIHLRCSHPLVSILFSLPSFSLPPPPSCPPFLFFFFPFTRCIRNCTAQHPSPQALRQKRGKKKKKGDELGGRVSGAPHNWPPSN